MAGALIVTAELERDDFAWLEGLRRTHYPPERNHVRAHLTIFHALAPSAQSELRSRLAKNVNRAAPKAWVEGLTDLDGGVAFRVTSPELDRIRDELARDLHGLLSPQDAHGWRPHITIQNKVAPRASRALIAQLERSFTRRPLGIRGLGLYRYLDGPWEELASYQFRR